MINQLEIEQAKLLAAIGNSQEAIAALSKLIQRDPNNVDVWLALAEVVKEPDRTQFCLQKVLTLDPGNLAAREMLARLVREGAAIGQRTGAAPRTPGTDASKLPAKPEKARLPTSEAQREAFRAKKRVSEQQTGQAKAATATAPATQNASAQTSAAPALQFGSLLRGVSLPALLEKLGQRFSLGRTDLILIALTALAGIVLIGLIGAALAGGSSRTPAESPDEVVQVVFDNIIAANREDLESYMATYHPDSPAYNTTSAMAQSSFALYDLSYEIFIPEMLEQGSEQAVISYVLTTRRMSGPDYQDNAVTGEITLRKLDGVWKIYDQRVSKVEYLIDA